MGKVSSNRRRFKIKQKRKRKGKIEKLKDKYKVVKSRKEKERIIKKIRIISTQYPINNIIQSEKKKNGG